MNKITTISAVLLAAIFGMGSAAAQNGQKRIVGGSQADPEAYPWVVELLDDSFNHICGASLVAPGWVLTAGHCAQGWLPFIPPPSQIYVNPWSHSNPQASTETIDVEQIYLFPGYDAMGTEYRPDIALIRLSQNSTHTPVEMMLLEQDLHLIEPGDPCQALGWGSTDAFGTQSDIMKVATIQVIDPEFCTTQYPDSELYDADSTICAGYLQGQPQEGAGAGDSGGPLFVMKNGNPLLVGIVSGGEEIITTDQYPGIYTKVFMVRDWIQNTMNAPAGTAESTANHLSVSFAENGLVVDSKTHIPEPMTYALYDMQGALIQSGKLQVSIGKTVLPVVMEHPSGVYLFNLSGSALNLQERVVKIQGY